VHRFYQEQYQLDGGRMDRYSTGSDAAGLTQGYYDTRQLPSTSTCTTAGAPHYVIADRFFQAAFGGSFLNHQYLVAAQAPPWPDAPAATHSVSTPRASRTRTRRPRAPGVRPYPLHTSNPSLNDGPVTQACPGRAASPAATTRSTRSSRPTRPARAAPTRCRWSTT
jgi:phospholipase C